MSIALVLATAAFDTATLHSLYGDGSDYLVQILASRTFFFVNASRRFTEILTQLPIVFAVKGGLTKLPLLIFIHSLGLVFIPATFWALALWRLGRDDLFWPMFVLFSIIHFNFAFFAIGEYNVAYPLVALSIAILSARAEITIFWGTVALSAAICLIASYEALVFLGPLLAILVCQRFADLKVSVGRGSHEIELGLIIKRRYLSRSLKILLVLCLSCYLAAAIVAGYSILYPRDPRNYASAANLLAAARNSFLVVSVAFAFAYWLSFSASVSTRRLANMTAMCCLLALAWPWFWSAPAMQYFSRTLGGIIVLLFGAIVLLRSPINYWLRIDLSKAASVNVYYPILLFGVLLISDLTRSMEFMNYLNDFKKEVRTNTGLIPLEATDLNSHHENIYGWWTHPTLSILLRENTEQSVILNSKKWDFFEPFDPRTGIPDLSIYYGGR